jgi:hypothetical protein
MRYPAQGYIVSPNIELMNGYNIVGLSRDFAAVMDGPASFGNKAFRWVSTGETTDSNKGGYEEVSTSEPVEPGEGYFVERGASAVLPDMDAYSDMSVEQFEIPLSPGWNIISNPYGGNVRLSEVLVQQESDIPVTWTEACTNRLVTNAIYSYLGSDWGSTYTFESAGGIPEATLVPWSGYWIYVIRGNANFKLIIPRP